MVKPRWRMKKKGQGAFKEKESKLRHRKEELKPMC
jgi:hypothetical protein